MKGTVTTTGRVDVTPVVTYEDGRVSEDAVYGISPRPWAVDGAEGLYVSPATD